MLQPNVPRLLKGLRIADFEAIAGDKKIPVVCMEVEGVMALKKTFLKPVTVYCRPPAEDLDEKLKVGHFRVSA